MAKLVIISGETRREVELGERDTLGRQHGNTILIPDRSVSKCHAEIRRTPDGRHLLRDLHSRNGTHIRGRRLDNECLLNDGDEFFVGLARVLFVDPKRPGVALPGVTLVEGPHRGRITGRLEPEAAGFLPECRIADSRVLRQDYESLRIAHEFGKAIAGELDLSRLLPRILEKAFELMEAERGVLLMAGEDGQWVPRHLRTRHGEHDSPMVISRTLIGEVVRTGAAVLSSDALQDERFLGVPSIVGLGLRSSMTLPLLHAGQLLGILHVDSLSQSGAFDEKDLQICAGMAAQAAIAIQNTRLAGRIEEEARMRAQLSRLVPLPVVDQVVKGELVIEKGGRLSEITMLFADIRGFTTLSDGKPAREIVDTLNDYFEVVVEVLFKHGGMLDKFVGDGVIGLFGAPIPMADAPFGAVRCAIEMLEALETFNAGRVESNRPPIRIGIGINTGTVVTGAIGSTKALQYTAIGDPMNVASRLVDVANAGEIILSEHTYRAVADRVAAEALPPVRVKGKADELKVHRVLGMRPAKNLRGDSPLEGG